MHVTCLGAGQHVGKSCIIVTIQNYTIMLDCGMHMGYNDHRRFPNFSSLSKTNNFDKLIDCIIISHFHLDHCGALPYFTEVLKFNGPIYMTHPTKGICPILLEDNLKICNRNDTVINFYSSKDIKKCMEKVICINMCETYEHSKNFIIKPYPAGHVLGAAMFYVKVGNESFVYTGDYNMTPDRHLGSAWIDCLRPDLLITEATYGSTIRECRKTKENEFISAVYECVKNGGKVLVPIFVFGRAQEMCLLIDSFWERMGLKIPIYLTTGMAEKANEIYRQFINYTNQTVKERFIERNLFEFKHIQQLDMHVIDRNEPMVIFASPGMLHSGTSLNIFLKICEDERNMIVIPGYCVKGTVGDKVINGEKMINVRNRNYEVRLKVKALAFSAHADAKGIMELIKQCQPRNVMLVHGDRLRMQSLMKCINKEFNITVFAPENEMNVEIPESNEIRLSINDELIRNIILPHEGKKKISKRFVVINDADSVFKIQKCEDFIIDNRKEFKDK